MEFPLDTTTFCILFSKMRKLSFSKVQSLSVTEPPCLNYYNQTGTCVPITSCQSLLNLESNPLRTFGDLLILDGSYCGPETSLKWVCCVSGILSTEKPLEISTAKTPVVRSTTQKTPFKIVTPLPFKSKRAIINLVERNRLLPDPDNDECGLHFPDRVVGGNQTALDEHPWTALLGYVLCKVFFTKTLLQLQ